MIFFGGRINALRRKATTAAKELVAIEDPVAQSLKHCQVAHELASWRHRWVARHVDEAWVAISHALTRERVQRIINRS